MKGNIQTKAPDLIIFEAYYAGNMVYSQDIKEIIL